MRNIVKSDKMLHAMRMNEAELNYFCRIYFKDVTNDISQDILERKYDALHAFVEASNAQVIS